MPSVFASKYGFYHIREAAGFELAITGLGIVFAALTFISLFIGLLPHATALFEKLSPEPDDFPQTAPAAVRQLDASVIAAIGYALHASRRGETNRRESNN